MVFLRRCSVKSLVLLFFATIVLVNFYFLFTVVDESYELEKKSGDNVQNFKPNSRVIGKKLKNDSKKKKKIGKYYVVNKKSQIEATINAEKRIKSVAGYLFNEYKNNLYSQINILENITKNFIEIENNNHKMWKVAESWVNGNQVLPQEAPLLGSVLNSLFSAKIIKADNAKKGTQLKLMLTLEGGQQALFKPQWYPRNEIIKGPVFSGKDRHNGEIAAFYLSLILNLRRVPITIGKKINLRSEIMPYATPELLNTFYDDGNNTCFYGVCLYCEPKSLVCAKNDMIEGALIMWLPTKIKFERYPNPWQRSYKSNLVARWEIEENYCSEIKSSKQYNLKNNSRLLDLIDAAVFDFLIDNGDRHHYEVPVGFNHSSIFLFDNGKSFGNPYSDHIDILAPLYQCCVIRKSTWERLKMFSGGLLSASLGNLLKYSHIAPVLTNSHLLALDRRQLFIFGAIEICVKEYGKSKVFF